MIDLDADFMHFNGLVIFCAYMLVIYLVLCSFSKKKG